MNPFESATRLVPIGADEFAWQVPDGWQQGRGAWGGLVVAALARAVTACEPDADRTLRSVSVQMAAPAMVGEHRVDVALVRRGASMSTWSASCRDARGESVARLVAVVGAPRAEVAGPDPAGWGTVVPPAAPAADEVSEVTLAAPLGPVFMQHFRFQPIAGIPMSGGRAESLGWVGFAEATAPTAISLLAIVDAWWPAMLPILHEMPRVATVNFLANLLVDPATVASGEPLLTHSFVTAAADGFTSEHRRLWTGDGRLVVDNVQTMVVGAGASRCV